MYVKCGDQYYVDYMVLTKPRMDPGTGKCPELVMYRCSTFPEFIMVYLHYSATLPSRRDSPHWSVEETVARQCQEPV